MNSTSNMPSSAAKPKIYMIDNLDSFTYNLVDEFQVLGYELVIYRNTLSADFIMSQIESCDTPVLIVLSPGPGTPQSAGSLMEVIARAAGKYPILGICLGHQALIAHYGGTIGRAPEIVHGKASNITHCQTGAFEGIANPLPIARYHSLVATMVPDDINVIAAYEIDEHTTLPMAVVHNRDNILGFQFHPESILTTYGSNLLAQSVKYLAAHENAQQQTKEMI
ncbi:aminodeoxychorismate/anthranilate synthase component II [Thalassotalea fusca]